MKEYQGDCDLHLTYSPRRGYWHFVLYIEPPIGLGSALNASHILETSASSYAAEWLDRLTPCEPDALHVARVGKNDAPSLWDACVYEDPNSPSAIAGDGCVCWQTFHDPITGLPVVAHHYRTVGGDIESWRHYTYSPLAFPDDERLYKLIIDSEANTIWARTESGVLHFLPEKRGAGYSVGYGGGGPTELARMIEKIVKSDGQYVAAGTPREMPGKGIMSWVSSKAAKRTREFTLDQLGVLCHGGTLE